MLASTRKFNLSAVQTHQFYYSVIKFTGSSCATNHPEQVFSTFKTKFQCIKMFWDMEIKRFLNVFWIHKFLITLLIIFELELI